MPIYEYRCSSCGRRASIFFRSIAAIEENPACPHCGERSLDRRMSRVWSLSRSREDAPPEPSYESDGVPFYGDAPDLGGDDWGYDDPGEAGDFSEEDIAAFARETREMAAMMGEPVDANLDTALRHIEQGADPDDVLGELDASTAGVDPIPDTISDDE